MENLKFIIEELNKIFPTDYNCFTFNNLPGEELLQVILDVMRHLDILDKFEKHESAPVEISRKLEAIKYTDKLEELKSGLQEGNRVVIYGVLHFLLKNQKNVATRNYLSKYADPIEVPEAFRAGDPQVIFLEKQYDGLMEEFWKAYSGNRLEKSWASEAKELEEDIWQMRLDMGNLTKRLNLQKGKLEESGIDNKRFEFTKELCAEEKRHAKLLKQVEEEKHRLTDLNELLVFYLKRKPVVDLEDFLENVEINKQNNSIIASICEDLKIDSKLMKAVAEETHNPDSEEIEDLQRSVYRLQNSLRDLKMRAGETFATDRVLRKRKDLVGKQILKVQAKNDCLIGKIKEILSLLGGDVLTGKSLKEYVGQLRRTSTVYKERKKRLNSLERELGILKKTLERLCEVDAGVRITLKKETMPTTVENQDDSKPITKLKLSGKFTEFTTLKDDFLLLKTKHDALREAYTKLHDDFIRKKSEFEAHAGDLIKDVSVLDSEYEVLNETIKVELSDLGRYVEEAESFKESLLRYSQYIIEDTEGAAYMEVLEHKLQVLLKKNGELKRGCELRREESERVSREKEAIRNVIDLVVLKFNN